MHIRTESQVFEKENIFCPSNCCFGWKPEMLNYKILPNQTMGEKDNLG
jgi:hypothetical protein